MKELIDNIKNIEHGFKHIIEAGDFILKDKSINHYTIASDFLNDSSYQVRMLGTHILGKLSTENENAFLLLNTIVAEDENWRVQEMLAKAFEHYCKVKGYENSLPQIKKWLSDKNPKIKRATIEGLRIWTSRAYFKDNPLVAIELISKHKSDESEYLRKSVGNALRDIRKKYPEEVLFEISNWNLSNKRIEFTYKLVNGK